MHQSSSNKEVHTEEEKEEHSPVKKNQKLGQINDLRALQIKKKNAASNSTATRIALQTNGNCECRGSVGHFASTTI